MRSLLLLMTHEVRSEVSPRVLCTDASHWGKGAVHGWLAPSQVDVYLRERDRWRFRADPQAFRDLRTTALEKALGIHMESEQNEVADVDNIRQTHTAYDIPVVTTPERASLLGIDWKVLHSQRWSYQEHITAL